MYQFKLTFFIFVQAVSLYTLTFLVVLGKTLLQALAEAILSEKLIHQ